MLRRNVKLDTEGLKRETGRLKRETGYLKRELPKLVGLDVREGVERLGGSWEIYADILNDFIKSQKGFVAEFQDIVQKGDFKAAREKAHALKGAAGNVSATDLRITAKALEDVCRTADEDQMLDVLTLVENAFVQVMENIPFLEKEKVAKSLEPDEAEYDLSMICELLETLDKNLQDFDPIESERCFKKLPDLPDNPSDSLKTDLGRQIGTYSFDEARETLGRLADKIKSEG